MQADESEEDDRKEPRHTCQPATSSSAISNRSLEAVSLSPLSPLNVDLTKAADCFAITSKPSSSSHSQVLNVPSTSLKQGRCGAKLGKFIDSMTTKQIAETKLQMARFFYAENIPFSMVESSFFKDFMGTLRPAFANHIPSRYELSTPLLNGTYEEMKTKVSSYMNDVEKVCLVSDGWSNVRGDSIINFVFTTPRPIFYKSINATGESHTGEFIGAELCKVIEEIGPEKVAAVVTDNAANMKSAWQYVQQKYPHIFCVGCVAHGMHLLCKDLITKIKWIQEVCEKSETIVNYFCKHYRTKHELEEQQQRRYGRVIALKKYCPTRWGTIHAMFKCLMDSKEALLSVAGFVDTKAVVRSTLLDEESFWTKVSIIESIFQPIVQCLVEFEKDDPVLSTVYPKLYKLQDALICKEFQDKAKIKDLLEKRMAFIVNDTLLLGKFNLYMAYATYQYFTCHSTFLTFCRSAHLLDPCQRGAVLSDEQLTNLRSFLRGRVGGDFQKVWTELLQYRAKTGNFTSSSIWEDAQFVDSITWWKCHGTAATSLSKLALTVMSIPTSSAASERCWSVMGNIHSDNRNRLTDEHVEKLVFIYFNERMLRNSCNDI